MKKAMYEQPNLKMLILAEEDVVRTSGDPVTGEGDAVFEDYTTENWS